MSTSATQWITSFAKAINATEPDDETRQAILDLAGAAAHASERTAAPVACWLAASVGLSAGEARDVARTIEVDTDEGELGA